MITLKNFEADNIPVKKQVEYLGQFLLENFGKQIGGNEKPKGEGATEMAVRLLLKLKRIEQTINDN